MNALRERRTRRGLAREMARDPASIGTRAEIALARQRYQEAFALVRARHFGEQLLVADTEAFDDRSAALFAVVFPACTLMGLDAEASALSEALERVGGALRHGLPMAAEAEAATRVFDALAAAFDQELARAEAAAPERRR